MKDTNDNREPANPGWLHWLGSLMRRLLRIDARKESIVRYPIVHDFPNIGSDGNVTMHCAIWPNAGPNGDYAALRKKANDCRSGVAPHRVGALVVEIDQIGLTLRWEPAKLSNDTLASPFGASQCSEIPDEPTDDGSDDNGD